MTDETWKEKAKRLRKEAYQKAKASPAAQARKAKAKVVRKAAYEQAKARKRERDGKAPLPPKAETPKATQEELLAAVTTADQLDVPPELRDRPKLRLIQGGDDK